MRWDPDTIFWCWYLLMTHCGIICLRWRWFSSTVTFNVSIDLSNIHNNPINAHYLTMQWHRRNHLFSGALSSIFFSEKNGLWHGIGGEFMVLLKFSRWYEVDFRIIMCLSPAASLPFVDIQFQAGYLRVKVGFFMVLKHKIFILWKIL